MPGFKPTTSQLWDLCLNHQTTAPRLFSNYIVKNWSTSKLGKGIYCVLNFNRLWNISKKFFFYNFDELRFLSRLSYFLYTTLLHFVLTKVLIPKLHRSITLQRGLKYIFFVISILHSILFKRCYFSQILRKANKIKCGKKGGKTTS